MDQFVRRNEPVNGKLFTFWGQVCITHRHLDCRITHGWEAAAPEMEEQRQQKAELIAALARRPAMPAGVRLVSWSPRGSPVQLSECSIITDTEKFICTTLRQVEVLFQGKGGWTPPWTGRVPVEGLFKSPRR